MVGRKNPYRDLERSLGYTFRKKVHLETALTHRSYRFEQEGQGADNQRLEYLGDAVLGFLTAAHLYGAHRGGDEGKLTVLRSLMTSGKALADCAKNLELGEYLRIGVGEERSGGRRRASNLADALEAVIGAAYEDGGIGACRKIFRRLFVPMLSEQGQNVWTENPKGLLQQTCQRIWKESPVYDVVLREGPPHASIFTVSATAPDGTRGQGKGPNKQEAEARAAGVLLDRMGVSRLS